MNKSALIIATYEYADPGLKKLVAPPQDADALAKVLGDPRIGGFNVQLLLNEPSSVVNPKIESFFTGKRDESLLLFFSGHGIKDYQGRLYLATPDTKLKNLRTTAIPASLINDLMRESFAKQQILILDCCYSGAFTKGMVVKAANSIGERIQTDHYFSGQGKYILTASDSVQYAFQDDEVQGSGNRSIFTGILVEGLETGEADLNFDGLISVKELYDYTRSHVTRKLPQQEPRFFAIDTSGDIYIAQSSNRSKKTAKLPSPLYRHIRDPYPWAREGAIKELEQLLKIKNSKKAEEVRKVLRFMLDDPESNISFSVARVLGQYLMREMQYCFLGTLENISHTNWSAISSLDIFTLIGGADGSPTLKQTFLVELQWVVAQDFMEQGITRILSREQLTHFQEVHARNNKSAAKVNDIQSMEISLGYLEKFIPNLSTLLLNKCLELKVYLMWERIAGMKEYYAKNKKALASLDKAQNLHQTKRYHEAAQVLNNIY